MNVLAISHEDFELIVECNNFHSTFNKARSKQNEILTATSYTAVGANLKLIDPITGQLENSNFSATHPVFFENKDYFIGATFKNPKAVKRASFHSRLKEVQDKFYYRREIGFLAGTINYGNDLGQTDLILRYEVDSG